MVVIRDDRNVRGMFWNASLMSITVMYFIPCNLWRFSSKVGMMASYGLVEGLVRVPPAMLEIQSVGWDTRTSWPVAWYASSAVLIDSSFEMGWQWMGTWMGMMSVLRSKSTGGPRKPRPWKSEVQWYTLLKYLSLVTGALRYLGVSGAALLLNLCERLGQVSVDVWQ